MVGRNNLYNAVKHFESSVCLLCAVGYTDESGVCNEVENGDRRALFLGRKTEGPCKYLRMHLGVHNA